MKLQVLCTSGFKSVKPSYYMTLFAGPDCEYTRAMCQLIISNPRTPRGAAKGHRTPATVIIKCIHSRSTMKRLLSNIWVTTTLLVFSTLNNFICLPNMKASLRSSKIYYAVCALIIYFLLINDKDNI